MSELTPEEREAIREPCDIKQLSPGTLVYEALESLTEGDVPSSIDELSAECCLVVVRFAEGGCGVVSLRTSRPKDGAWIYASQRACYRRIEDSVLAAIAEERRYAKVCMDAADKWESWLKDQTHEPT